MAVTTARYFGPLGERSFWSFRVVHALTGALLTILGAASGVFVNEHIKGQIGDLDGQIDEANQRYQEISQALFKFDFTETNAITLGVLSQNGSLMPDFRQEMVDLMFVTRQNPTEEVLGQIYRADAKAFAATRQTYTDLIAAARKSTASLDDWNAVLAYEYQQEMKLDGVQSSLVTGIQALKDKRRDMEGQLDLAIVAGFALQQVGFVIVLLAGLLHQHRTPDALPLYEVHGRGGE